MWAHRSLVGNGAVLSRKLEIGATVVNGQIVCNDANQYGVVGAPASVNDQTEAWGVTTEAGTYAATQADGKQAVEVSLAVLATFLGVCTGGTTETDFAFALDGNLLTNSTLNAAGTTVADTNVGTSEFVGGLLVGLTGANKGIARRITAHTDNVSTVVTKAFPNDIAAADTFIRCFGPGGDTGHETTTDFTMLNMTPSAGVDLPDTGHLIGYALHVDGFAVENYNHVEILNPTLPSVYLEFVFGDHAFNPVA